MVREDACFQECSLASRSCRRDAKVKPYVRLLRQKDIKDEERTLLSQRKARLLLSDQGPQSCIPGSVRLGVVLWVEMSFQAQRWHVTFCVTSLRILAPTMCVDRASLFMCGGQSDLWHRRVQSKRCRHAQSAFKHCSRSHIKTRHVLHADGLACA